MKRFAAVAPAIHRDLTVLTPRELDVLTLMARVFAKLTLRDRARAVVLAYETGLVRPGD